jgi:Flp pilus assembly protein TadD
MRHEGRYYRAAALFLAGRSAEAERELRILLGAEPRHAKGHNLLGAVCAAVRNLECARAAFINAQKLDPRDASVYVNLGYLSLDTGDPAAAVAYFREALVIDPTSDAARKGIADAMIRIKD